MAGSMEQPQGNPDDYSAQSIIPTAAVMLALSGGAVALRFYSRRMTGVSLWWDDWIILLALPLSWAMCIGSIVGATVTGLGKHMDTLIASHQAERFLVLLYAFQVLYCVAVNLPKYSIVALYWRVFGFENFKWPLLVVSAIITVNFVAVTLVAILPCIPVDGLWDVAIPAKCVSLLQFYIGQAVANIALDLILLLIPILLIRRLNMSRAQKIAVAGIFGLGIFVTVCSAIRLSSLLITQTDPHARLDPSYYFVAATVWSYVETCLSIVCSCLPSMRPLLSAAMRRTFGSSGARSRATPSSRNRSGYGQGTVTSGTGRGHGLSSLRGSLPGFGRSASRSSVFDRAQRWHRVNGGYASDPTRSRNDDAAGSTVPLARLCSTRSNGYSDPADKEFGRDVWRRSRAEPDIEEASDPDTRPTTASGEKQVTPFEAESIRAPERVQHKSMDNPTGPVRLAEYEIRSESAEGLDGRGQRMGYMYHIRGGAGA